MCDRCTELEARVKAMDGAATERTRQINQLKDKLRNPEKRFADLQADLAAAQAREAQMREALREIERHHIKRNQEVKRPLERSHTLTVAKAALSTPPDTTALDALLEKARLQELHEAAKRVRSLSSMQTPDGRRWVKSHEVQRAILKLLEFAENRAAILKEDK